MTRIPRFHHAGELADHQQLTLSKTATHHLVTVLRAREGDVIELFNGDGNNYRATVLDAAVRGAGKSATLQLHESTDAQTESPVQILLVQAISRGDRMDTTIRQSVELGVNRIQPVFTRHSARALDEKRSAKKQEHWQSIIVSACEQSGRALVPTLAEPVMLAAWLEERALADPSQQPLYVLAPQAHASLTARLRSQHGNAREQALTGLIVGPESGLDDDEIAQACSVGAEAVSLGPRILRTETAGPTCVALVQATLGDLG